MTENKLSVMEARPAVVGDGDLNHCAVTATDTVHSEHSMCAAQRCHSVDQWIQNRTSHSCTRMHADPVNHDDVEKYSNE
jgi:hypothetical protein